MTNNLTNRSQVRALLMPGIYQRAEQRGVPFTPDEENAVIEAYCAAAESGADSNECIRTAIIALSHLTALPLTIARRQRDLVQMRSLSAAYRRSQIPEPFRTAWAERGR